MPAAIQQTSLGTPDAFGGGIVAATTRTVTVDLKAPAHVAVVRVFPGDSAVLAYPSMSAAARAPLHAGVQRLELAVQRVRDFRPDLLARGHSDSGDENACRMRRTASEAARRRDTLNPRPSTPFWDTCITRPNHLDVQPAGTTVLGAPIPPGPHYLVVIATDVSLNPVLMTERLRELDISLASGAAAARTVPAYVVGEGGQWAAWVVHQP